MYVRHKHPSGMAMTRPYVNRNQFVKVSGDKPVEIQQVLLHESVKSDFEGWCRNYNLEIVEDHTTSIEKAVKIPIVPKQENVPPKEPSIPKEDDPPKEPIIPKQEDFKPRRVRRTQEQIRLDKEAEEAAKENTSDSE